MRIHPTALVDEGARLGRGVSVGPFTIIHGNVEIGDETSIGSHCEIGVPTSLSDGSPVRIGAGSLIRSHSVFYEGSSFEEGLETGHGVKVREGVKAGKNLRVGTMSDLQGDTVIGDYGRLHSNVHVGKTSVLGDFVWMFPYSVLTNDPTPPSDIMLGCTVEDFAVISTLSVVLPGIRIGRGSLVGAGSVVTRDVPPGRVVYGNPAHNTGWASDLLLHSGSGPAYPWTRHFHRGYPEEVVARWREWLYD